MGEKDFLKLIESDGTVRVRFRLSSIRGKLTAAVVQLEFQHLNDWYVVVRYDNAHGYMHRDEMAPSGREKKTTIQLSSLEEFVMHAELDIGDRWQWYCDRFVAKLRRRKRK